MKSSEAVMKTNVSRRAGGSLRVPDPFFIICGYVVMREVGEL